ncbi:MAG: SGNH/GDSL hydrolase family protein [Oligoflexia bacterium]|nr:SGNH/GDSL hydrolase family protein [Oligoflexia bacterium]
MNNQAVKKIDTLEAQQATGAKASWWALALVMLIGFSAALILFEIGLRLIGFQSRLFPEKIEFGWPNPQVLENLYQPDDQLLWVPKDYQAHIDELIANPPGILLMGDSCTQFGTYDEFLSQHLNQEFGEQAPRVDKVGVGGWSTFQGLQQMRRDVVRIKPKVATIYYGWNDHWIGFGVQDKVIATLRSPLYSLLEDLRTAQFVTKLYLLASQSDVSAFPYRVSERDYADNLRGMIDVARSAGISPMLLTAPSGHVVGKEPEYLKRRHLKDLSQLVPLHQRYVQLTREVAQQSGVALCDLAAEFEKLPSDEVRKKYFNSDGIHLTKKPGEGYDILSGMLLTCLKVNQLVP